MAGSLQAAAVDTWIVNFCAGGGGGGNFNVPTSTFADTTTTIFQNLNCGTKFLVHNSADWGGCVGVGNPRIKVPPAQKIRLNLCQLVLTVRV